MILRVTSSSVHQHLLDSWLAPQLPSLLPHSLQWSLQKSPDVYHSLHHKHPISTIVLVGNSTHHITHTAHADVMEQIHCLLQLLVELLGLFSLSKSKGVKESIINHYPIV